MSEDENTNKRNAENKITFTNKRSKMSAIVLRILIPNRCAGGIIGKGGENIKSLREQCPQANIKLRETPDCPNAEERIIHVECEEDELVGLLETLVPLIYKSFNKPGQVQIPEHEVSLLFSDNTVGGIIGKGGQCINNLRTDSGAKIKAFSGKLQNCEERIVLIKGTAEAIVEAIRLIYDRQDLESKPYRYYDPADSLLYPRDPGAGGYVESSQGMDFGPPTHTGPRHTGPRGGSGRPGGRPARKPDPYYSTGADQYGSTPDQFQPQSRGPPGYGFGAPEGYGPVEEQQGGLFARFITKFPFTSYTGDDSEMFVTKEVTLENNLTGCVIGDRGTRVKDVRSTSGARIRIGDWDSAGQGERLITIEGTNIQCHLAEYMLQCCVQTFSTSYQNTAKPSAPQRKKLVANPGVPCEAPVNTPSYPPSATNYSTPQTWNSSYQFPS